MDTDVNISTGDGYGNWTSDNSNFTPSTLMKVTTALIMYLTPIIIVVGVCGNVLSILVFHTRPLRRQCSSVYLAALAVSDTGYLVCLSITWLSYWGVQIIHRQPWCVFSVYLAYLCGFLSVWIVVSFTVERFIIVVFPLQGRNLLRSRRAIGVVVGLAIFSLLFYSYALFTSRIIEAMGMKQCAFDYKFMDFLAVMTHIDTVITLIVPSITIIVLNTLIGCFIYKASKEFSDSSSSLRFQSGDSRFSYSSNTMATAFTELSSDDESSKDRSATVTLEKPIRGGSINVKTQGRRKRDSRKSAQRKHIKSTKMLLIISSVFLLMNLPGHVIRIRQLVLQMMTPTYRPTPNEEAIGDLANLIYHANFAINFFLYSLCGEKFRRCVKNYLLSFKIKIKSCCCCCYQRNSKSVERNCVHSRTGNLLKNSVF